MSAERSVRAAAVGVLAVVATACGGGSGSSADGSTRTTRPAGDPAPATTVPAPGTTGAVAIPAAFRFAAPSLDGSRVEGADYAETGVALWFWAPW